MQQVTITPPASPGGPVVVTQAPAGTPTSPQEFRALVFRQEQLWEQLNQAKASKTEMLEEMKWVPKGDERLSSLKIRLTELDSRIARLENEHYVASDLVANAPAHVLNTATRAEPDRIVEQVMNDIVPLTAIVSGVVLLPLTLALVRLIWRRTAAPSHATLADHAATAKRLEQIQQSIDTIAVEVERISEGQRYTAKVMDRALGSGAAEPVHGEKLAFHAERR
ncbi:MAG: hypothetical protein ACRENU_00470 [Gemmatimonadaceae bacterium]